MGNSGFFVGLELWQALNRHPFSNMHFIFFNPNVGFIIQQLGSEAGAIQFPGDPSSDQERWASMSQVFLHRL